MRRYPAIHQVLLHTGQHYDADMSRIFFDDLGLPRPDVDLEVGSGSHAWQTAQVMLRFDPVLERLAPDLVLVVGDVNSTLACALVAAKRRIPVAHVEAGLRSFDRSMPEEINRMLTDTLADYLFTTCQDATDNLLRDGVPAERIFFVGNVMVDTLLQQRARAERSTIRQALGLERQSYALVTLHRPANVDDPVVMGCVVKTLCRLSLRLPVIFPAHPRTVQRLRQPPLADFLDQSHVCLIEPLGYVDFLHLMSHARLVLTDSGGVQEETTVLGVPCLTLRSNTERPVTIQEGTNTLVGTDPHRIMTEACHILHEGGKVGRIPTLWDGKAAQRILASLAQHFSLPRAEVERCDGVRADHRGDGGPTVW
jgi:UDP-N-acetylglucosamine 2-epimerase (non-hydrolysing)